MLYKVIGGIAGLLVGGVAGFCLMGLGADALIPQAEGHRGEEIRLEFERGLGILLLAGVIGIPVGGLAGCIQGVLLGTKIDKRGGLKGVQFRLWHLLVAIFRFVAILVFAVLCALAVVWLF